MSTSYRVVIEYREPTHAARAGTPRRPYRWVYRVEGAAPDAAAARALAEFRAVERESSVGWPREVVRVVVSVPPET